MKHIVNQAKSKHFNTLIEKFISKKSEATGLSGLFPTYSNINKQAKEKLLNYTNRDSLVFAIKKQHQNLDLSILQLTNIKLLENSNTATITTGHQLNLMGGPLYTIYKIIQTIKLSDELNANQKKINYVPIFWMASEDHDWSEINNFTTNNTKFEWSNIPKFGATGEFSTKDLPFFFKDFIENLEEKKYKKELINLIEFSYLNTNINNLAEASRKFFHELFKAFGLLILDANDLELKKLFIPYIKNEINNQTLFKEVSTTNLQLNKKEIQVKPREINLFYLENKLRERIIKSGELFKVNNTQIVFKKEQLERLIDTNPEKFSPNVLLRPLYQEVILPNAVYIGGGSEISYWLQLKPFFETQNVLFPILMVRNSILLVKEKQVKKLNSLKISWEDLFLPIDSLINLKIKEKSTLKIPFLDLKKEITKLYSKVSKRATKTEKTFLFLVTAQKVRQLKAIDLLEKRLLKAEKIKYNQDTKRIIEIKSSLFPNNLLQERTMNFSEFYLEHGNQLFNKIYTSIKPLDFNFTIIVL